jgi:hypothetical protein
LKPKIYGYGKSFGNNKKTGCWNDFAAKLFKRENRLNKKSYFSLLCCGEKKDDNLSQIVQFVYNCHVFSRSF